MASPKRSLTREAPTPTNISTKSEPEMLKNGTPASPATALARRVLPVPGGPSSKTPLGMRAPTLVYFPGSLRKSTISSNSSFSSFRPATFAKVTVLSFIFSVALDLPKFIIFALPLFAFWALTIINKNPPTASTISMGTRVVKNQLSLGTSFTVGSKPYDLTSASASTISDTNSFRSAPLLNVTFKYPVGTSALGCISTSCTLSCSTSRINCCLV